MLPVCALCYIVYTLIVEVSKWLKEKIEDRVPCCSEIAITIKQEVHMNIIKRFIYDIQGKVSLRKVGIAIIAASGAIITAHSDQDLNHYVPKALFIISKFAVMAGGLIALNGHIDAKDRSEL